MKAGTASADATVPGKIRVAPDGSVSVPSIITKTLALKGGDVLFVRIHDGEIRL
jgi:hypothetical protein